MHPNVCAWCVWGGLESELRHLQVCLSKLKLSLADRAAWYVLSEQPPASKLKVVVPECLHNSAGAHCSVAASLSLPCSLGMKMKVHPVTQPSHCPCESGLQFSLSLAGTGFPVAGEKDCPAPALPLLAQISLGRVGYAGPTLLLTPAGPFQLWLPHCCLSRSQQGAGVSWLSGNLSGDSSSTVPSSSSMFHGASCFSGS